MSARRLVSRSLIILGLAALLFGAADPMEGAFVILAGSGIATLGAFVDKDPHRRLLCGAFVQTAFGVGAMVVLTLLGGVGGRSGRSAWWMLVALPYPVGWLTGLVVIVLKGIDCFRSTDRQCRLVQQ